MAEDEGLEARLQGVMGTGDPETRRPVSLTEALYSRIVEVTRQEVSQTTEVLGELIIQMGRLDRRIGDIVERLENGPSAPAPAPAPPAEPAPPLDLEPITRAVDARLVEIRTAILSGQPDLSAVTDVVSKGLNDVRTAILTGQPDLSSVTAAIAELRDAIPAPSAAGPTEGAAPVDLSPLTAALAEVHEAAAREPDLTPMTDVVTQWLAEVRTTLSSKLDEVQRRLDQPADLTPVTEAISDRLAALEGSANAHQAVQASRLDDLATAVNQAVERLQARLDEAPAEPAETGQHPAVTAAIEGLESMLDGMRVDIASRDDRLGQHLDRIEQTAAEAKMGPELDAMATDLRGRLDAVQAAVTDGPDVAAVIRGAVAGTNDDLVAELENIKAAVAASGARFAARLDELRSELAGDRDAATARLESGLANVAAAAERPTEIDLSPLESGLAEVRSRLLELTARHETAQQAVAAGLAELQAGTGDQADLTGLVDGMGSVSQRLEGLADAIAGDNEALAARVDAARTELSAAVAAIHVGPQLDEAVSRLADRLSALEGAQSQSHEVVAARLDELHQLADRPIQGVEPDLSAITERITTGLADTRDQVVGAHQSVRDEVAGLAGSLAEIAGKVSEGPSAVQALAARLDTIERLAAQVEAGSRQTSADLAAGQAGTTEAVTAAVHDLTDQLTRVTAKLDEVRSAPPDPDVHAAEFEQLRVLIGNVADSVAAVGAKTGDDTLGALFDEHAGTAMTRLQEVTEGMLTRMERRDSQLSSLRADLEQTLGQSLSHLQGDLTSVREALSAAEQHEGQRFERIDSELSRVQSELGAVSQLQRGLTEVGERVDGLRALVMQGNDQSQDDRVTSGLAELTRDLAATRERVLEVDRSVASMKGDLAGSAEAAQASFQAADAVATLVQGVTRLESRLGIEVDDITRRLDAVAKALEAMAQADAARPSTAGRQRVASGMSDRLIAIREVAAGVSEAVRNDARRRRERKAIESGHRPSE
jgi:uncharacterized protein YqgV (UPF0045/DUF77 family)